MKILRAYRWLFSLYTFSALFFKCAVTDVVSRMNMNTNAKHAVRTLCIFEPVYAQSSVIRDR